IQPSFSFRLGCLTFGEQTKLRVFAFIVKRFRVFRAPLHGGTLGGKHTLAINLNNRIVNSPDPFKNILLAEFSK
ncbi:hypothetical protein AAHB56_24795, partial [Bacillus thuringiensis]